MFRVFRVFGGSRPENVTAEYTEYTERKRNSGVGLHKPSEAVNPIRTRKFKLDQRPCGHPKIRSKIKKGELWTRLEEEKLIRSLDRGSGITGAEFGIVSFSKIADEFVMKIIELRGDLRLDPFVVHFP